MLPKEYCQKPNPSVRQVLYVGKRKRCGKQVKCHSYCMLRLTVEEPHSMLTEGH